MKSKTKIEKQSRRKGNPTLVEMLRLAKKTGSPFWLQAAGVLSGPRRKKIAVNLNDIESITSEGDSIVIPGKVLSQGNVSKKIAVVAFAFSEKAKGKLLKVKSQAINMIDEIKKNPDAKGLKFFTGVEEEMKK